MDYLIGILLALAVSIFATLTGFDRDRSFYPVVLIVSAAVYELFAIMTGSVEILGLESIAFTGFLIVSLVGFKKNLWLVVAAFAGHGLFDLVHTHVIANPGVPSWWPNFCMSYDLAAAAYLGWLLTRTPAIHALGEKVLRAT